MAVDKDRLIEVVEQIAENIRADGGDLHFKSLDDDGTVHLELRGACVGCPLSAMEFGIGIERVLKEHVAGITHVDVQDEAPSEMQYGLPEEF